jgi:Uncharacterized ABC-type transport system, permease component
VLALLAVPIVWFVLTRTTFGFAIKAVGENARAAAYAGISTARTILATAAVSGALAGLAGVGQVGGVHYQVMADLSPGYGYTGIVIAMLARLNPLGVLPAAIFYAAMITGAEGMSRATGVPVFLADVIQGVSLLAMLTALLFTQYRLRVARPRMRDLPMHDLMAQLLQVGFFAALIRIATPLIFATLGELLAERSGVVNLGVEGIMLFSAMTGFTAAYYSGDLWIGIAAAAATGAVMGLLMGLLTVTLGLSQHVSGLGVTMLCTGFAFYFYRLIFGEPSQPPSVTPFHPLPIPLLSEIPVIGPVLFNQFALSYLAFAVVLVAAALALKHTPWGLSLRTVGENPRAADAAGVNVALIRYQALILSGALMGIGGAICRWPSTTPSPSASSPGGAGFRSPWWSSASGSPGAARWAPCSSP